MRILYITDQVYLHGGAEKILIQKLNFWVQYFGYEVMLITLQQEGRAPFFPIDPAVKHFDLGLNLPEGTSYFKKYLKKTSHAFNSFKTTNRCFCAGWYFPDIAQFCTIHFAFYLQKISDL